VGVTRYRPDPNPTAGSASANPPARRFRPDPVLRNTTLAPQREGHGCLDRAVTFSDGLGFGVGVTGNGDSGPVAISIIDDPLVGRFGADQPELRIFAMACHAEPSMSDGAMIDIAVTDAGGSPVPLPSKDVFWTVNEAISSSFPDYFAVFDPASLRLTQTDSDVVLSGVTTAVAGERFGFVLGVGYDVTSGRVRLVASAHPLTNR